MKRLQSSLTLGLNRIAIILAWLLLATASPAGNFATSIYQPYAEPPRTWNEAIWQPGPAVPTTGNTYEVLDGGLIRNPPLAGVQTFPGDWLTLDAGAGMKAKGPSGTTLNFPGVDGNPGLILNGGRVEAVDDQTFTIAGRVSVVSDSYIDHRSGARSFAITAQIEGNGSLTLINGGGSKPLDIQSAHNPYSGNWLIKEGYLKGTGDGSLGTGNITVSNGATLEIDYDIQSPGALTLLGSDSVMILHQDCQFGAVTINDIPLAPGIYDCAQLVAQFPDNFAGCGSGSITILPLIPPPTGLAATDGAGQADVSSTVSAEVASDIAVPSGTSPDTSVGASGLDTTLRLIPMGIIDTTAPLVAMGVIVAADSMSQIAIRWNASSDSGGSGIAGYKIYRNGALVATTTANSYSDTRLDPGSQYCYTIVAFDGAGNASSRSPQSCATTPTTDTAPPSIPTGVIASATSYTEVTVQWDASADTGGLVKGYRIFCNGMLVGLATTTSFSDDGLAPDTQYCYTVDAFDYRYNRSSASAQACTTTFTSPGPPPAAPSNLTVIVVTPTSIMLNWEDNSNDELGFEIEQASSADGPWSLLVTATADATSYYADSGLAPSTTYYYRVSAFN